LIAEEPIKEISISELGANRIQLDEKFSFVFTLLPENIFW